MALQKKNITLQDALSSVDAARSYYSRLCSEEEFTASLVQLLVLLRSIKLVAPGLPRFRHHSSRIEGGSMPHEGILLSHLQSRL